MSFEVNFDQIVSPTHNHSVLSYGNTASEKHHMFPSNPLEAALQGLEKMKFLHSLGLRQGILPPQQRPHMETLRRLGYYGSDADILKKAWQHTPQILMAVSSPSSMWMANSATVTPSYDSIDGHVHITSANLSSKFHRSIETANTSNLLKTIFANPMYFQHHDPLPAGSYFSDEGAANHISFNRKHGSDGVHLFVYGRQSFRQNLYAPKVYPARQTLEASQAIARLHQIPPEKTCFFQQHPDAIDAGVFHNDVISLGNNNFFLYHEKAFCNPESSLEELENAVLKTCGIPLLSVKVLESQVPIKDAVESYLFNSQLVTLDDSSMALIAPTECQRVPSVFNFIEELIQDRDNPIGRVHYLELNESMCSGGGPACLRLRVVLNENELNAVNPRFLFTDELYQALNTLIKKHYRTELYPKDLADPQFFKEAQEAREAIEALFQNPV